jgi:aromatic ring-cleaving dioxygenase
MVINKKAAISGYHAHVWYNKNAIANILALRNIIKQYRVTFDSDDKMFVVDRGESPSANRT